MKCKKTRLILLTALTLGMACTPKKPSAAQEPNQNASTSSAEGAVISGIEIADSPEGSEVIFHANQTTSPNIFRLSDPERIVVDFLATKISDLSKATPSGKGVVSEVNANQFEDGGSTLSRIVLSLNNSADYQAENRGNDLVLKIGGAPAPAIAAANSIPQEVPLDAVSKEPEQSPMNATPETSALATTPPETVAPSLDAAPMETASTDVQSADSTEAPAQDGLSTDVPTDSAVVSQATELNDIRYEQTAEGTTIRLVGNAPIQNYQDFVLYDPQRIVVDLKGVENAYKGRKQISLQTDEIGKVRVGGKGNDIRVVLDTASKETPQYSLSTDGNDLLIHVQKHVDATPVEMAKTENAIEPAAPAPAFAEPSVPATVEEPAPVQAAAVEAPVVAKRSTPVTITSIDFKQLENTNKSRLTIGLSSSDASYEMETLGQGQIALVVDRAKIQSSNLKRAIDTSEFKTAVTRVTPKEENGKTKLLVKLEQDVPYSVVQDGNFLHLDVDIPDQILRSQTPNLVAQNTQAAPEIAGGVSEQVLTEDVNTEAPKAKAAPAKLKNDYRYVREEFMNDSMTDDEPLSRMAAIMAGSVDGKKFSGRKISMDFKDADVRSVFRLIADISKFNMIISDDVDGRITIRLDDVPWDQAFAIILQTRGLWFEKYGNIVRIAPADKLRKERELAAAAQKAAKAAKPLDVLFKPVSFADASTLIKQVSSMLSDRGSVDIDSRTNTLIIKDIREHLDRAKRLVDILDTQTPQVTIEARIVEATSTFTRSFGIQWFGKTGFTPRTGNPTGVFFPNSIDVPFAMNFPIDAGFENTRVDLKLGSINDILDIDLALRLGEQEGHSKLISAPKITVLDNKAATITAGSRIPFITQTANAGSNIRFENAATTLTVTPHITNEGSILMNVSATRNEPNFAQAIEGNPLIDQRSAQTEVLVKSGNTTVIGGIYSTQQANSQSRLPFISKIPVIGALFRNYNKSLRRTELLIFVTPRIVGDEREATKDVRG